MNLRNVSLVGLALVAFAIFTLVFRESFFPANDSVSWIKVYNVFKKL